jgi:hypothetical protein
MEGSAERTRKRLAAHDYSGGSSVRWNESLVTEFLLLNRRGPDGRYEQKDWQLAERFSATIPSIQYMRRKLSKVEVLLGRRASQGKIVEYLLCAESVLSRGREAVEGSKTERRRKTEAAKKSVVKTDKAKPRSGTEKATKAKGKEKAGDKPAKTVPKRAKRN